MTVITAAIEDLERLRRRDPRILRDVLKKVLLLERNPYAGESLLGGLVGFRKLVVGRNHWRIVWRVLETDGEVVVEIAEVWAVGNRADGEVYREALARLEALGDDPEAVVLAAFVGELGTRLAGDVTPAAPPGSDPVPDWLRERLRYTAGVPRSDVDGLTGEQAMERWERYLRGEADQEP